MAQKSMNWNSSQIPSPKESMHSISLLHMPRRDIHVSERNSNPHFEIAAWLKLKNTERLPSMLLMEYRDKTGAYWQILDTATLRENKGTVLLSGAVDPEVKHLQEINLYLCHPSPFIDCEIEELRFNNELQQQDYLSEFNVA